MLGCASDNDRRSKRFCTNAVLYVTFVSQMVKTRVIRLRVVVGCIPFILSASPNECWLDAGYIHATHA